MSYVVGIVAPIVRDGSVPKPIYEITRDDVETDFSYPYVVLADCFSDYFYSKEKSERRI